MLTDKQTGISIRFVKEWDIQADQHPTRMDGWAMKPPYPADRSECPKCRRAAYLTKGGMWHCDTCQIGWEPPR